MRRQLREVWASPASYESGKRKTFSGFFLEKRDIGVSLAML